jgi:hypothetical protein
MIRQSTGEPQVTMEEINDPVAIARCRSQDEHAKRNNHWLQAHWTMLLPQASGKFVAVAGQEAFIADTAGQAWRMARAAHPEDHGIISQYVFPGRGPRIYAYRR